MPALAVTGVGAHGKTEEAPDWKGNTWTHEVRVRHDVADLGVDTLKNKMQFPWCAERRGLTEQSDHLHVS